MSSTRSSVRSGVFTRSKSNLGKCKSLRSVFNSIRTVEQTRLARTKFAQLTNLPFKNQWHESPLLNPPFSRHHKPIPWVHKLVRTTVKNGTPFFHRSMSGNPPPPTVVRKWLGPPPFMSEKVYGVSWSLIRLRQKTQSPALNVRMYRRPRCVKG